MLCKARFPLLIMLTMLTMLLYVPPAHASWGMGNFIKRALERVNWVTQTYTNWDQADRTRTRAFPEAPPKRPVPLVSPSSSSPGAKRK